MNVPLLLSVADWSRNRSNETEIIMAVVAEAGTQGSPIST